MEDSSGYAICTNARKDSSLEEFVLHVPVLAPWLHRGNTAMLGIRKLSRISYVCGQPLFVFDLNSLLTFKFLFRGWQTLTHQTGTVIFSNWMNWKMKTGSNSLQDCPQIYNSAYFSNNIVQPLSCKSSLQNQHSTTGKWCPLWLHCSCCSSKGWHPFSSTW